VGDLRYAIGRNGASPEQPAYAVPMDEAILGNCPSETAGRYLKRRAEKRAPVFRKSDATAKA
jgi:hypothetical protein